LTILNESGVPDVLPPLHAANGLTRRHPGALVVVVGTRAEAHLVQSLPTVPAPCLTRARQSARLVSLVLDPDDPPPQGRIASRVIEAAAGYRGIELVLIIGGRAAAQLGVDASFEARLVSRRLELPTLTVDHDAPYGPPGILSTDLQDRVIAGLVATCPKRRTSDLVETDPPARTLASGLFGGLLGGSRGREEELARPGRPVVLLGAYSAPAAARELTGELARVGVEVAGAVPPAGATGGLTDLPPVGEGTVVAVMESNLTAAAEAAQERGATLVETLMPVGVDGTARFIQDVAAETGASANELMRARAVWADLEYLRNQIRGKRIFFAGDTGFEIPLARFLADAGAVVLEVGAPRLDRRSLAAELQALGPDVDVVESPDWRGQLARIDAARPDVVVASAGLHVPLVARGHLCRSPHDFLAASPCGYGGARRILELFAHTFERAATLDSVNL
jgi:light-independent protochlorophyllide reductase subunit N